jgi:hypothetical protein
MLVPRPRENKKMVEKHWSPSMLGVARHPAGRGVATINHKNKSKVTTNKLPELINLLFSVTLSQHQQTPTATWKLLGIRPV